MTTPSFSRWFPILFLAAVSVASARQEPAPSPSMPELFQKGKTAFKLGNYKASLEAFDKLDELSLSANELDRSKLAPVTAFYRGANLAMLGETERARGQFEKYLALVPAAHLDPAAFPKPVITLFDAVRERMERKSEAGGKGPSAGGGMMADYTRYGPGPSQSPDGRWADGAIRFLMTRAERDMWQRLTDDTQRAEFIANFWHQRDPTPLTPENEFRDEIERRIRYADAHFAAEEKRGSATDRGLVFVLLGPPSYVGQKPFRSEDDPVQAARAAPDQEIRLNADGSKTVILHPRTGLTAETLQGTREIWYYRRDRLPKVVKFTEVDFEFITRKGFGTAVLQRDHEVLVTLDLVASSTLPSRD